MRGVICTLPFVHILRQLKVEFIYVVVLWLNAFPVKKGISAIYSPLENCWCVGGLITKNIVKCSQEHTVRFRTNQCPPTQ